MPNTTNYNWATPADSDLVKDGAAAIRTLGSSIDSTLKTQIDAQIPDSLLTTTGDTIYASGASTPARLAVGTTGQVLTVAGGVPTWSTPTGSGLTFNGYKGPTNSTSFSVGTQRYFGKLNGYYIIVTDNGFILYSSDLKTWTRWASTATENTYTLYGAAYGAGVWIFFGSDGALYSASSIGGTLTARTSGFGVETIFAGCFTAGSINLFTIVGSNGLTASSSDGTSWTLRTANQSTSTILTVATDGSTTIVLAAQSSAAANASYSTNGTSWTTVSPDNSGTSTTFKQVYWDPTNSYFVYQQTTGVAYYVAKASVGSTWTLIDATPIGIYSSEPTRFSTTSDFRIYDSSRSSFFTFNEQAGAAQIIEYDLTQSYAPRNGYINYKVKNIYSVAYPINGGGLPNSRYVGYGYADGFHNLFGPNNLFMLSTAN